MNIKKYPYSKQFLKAALAAALVIAPVAGTATVFQPEQASAATAKVTTGFIEVLVIGDEKTSPANISDAEVFVTSKDAPGNVENPKVLSTGTTGTDGKFKTTALEAGTYYVTIAKGKNSQTTEVKVSGNSKVISPKFIYEDGTAPDVTKTGAVLGVVYNSTSDTGDVDVVGDNTVTLVSKKVQYTTQTNDNGVFKFFVPAGTYDVVVQGQEDGESDVNKNTIYEKIKVSKGQAASTLQTLNANDAWAKDANKLGFVPKDEDLKPESKSYTGAVAIGNGTVSVYDITTSDVATVDAAKLVATATVKPTDKKDLTKGGTYALKLKTAQPGRTLVFKVADKAGNVYFETKTLDKYDTKLTAAPAEKAPLGGNVALSFTDLTKAYASSITSVTVKAVTGDAATITVPKYDKTTKKGYSVSGTKLTISGDNFKNVGDYTVEVKATGFVDQSVKQTISVAKANAAALTATAAAGSTEDTTKVTVTKTTDDTTLFVQVKNEKVTAPKLGSALPAGSGVEGKNFITNYKSGADIPFDLGEKATAKGYLAVYEVNSLNQVVAFSFLTVTQSQVKNDVKK